MASIINASNSGFGGIVSTGDSSGQLQLQTAATTAVTIDTSQNVGIGTTSPSAKFHVANAGVSAQATFVGTTLSPYITVVGNSGTTILGNESNGGWVGTVGSQAFVFKTTDTERMRIDTSGNVGIGTASPAATLDVRSGSDNPQLQIRKNSGGDSYTRFNLYNTSTAYFQLAASPSVTDASSIMNVYTSGGGGNIMSFLGNGNVGIGNTSPNTRLIVSANTGTAVQRIFNLVGTNTYQMSFNNSVGEVGTISTGSGSTAYNTSSDYRLKDNIVPMSGALDKISQLNPVNWIWKVDGTNGQGFIAHELQAIIPDCVTGEKDAVDEEGNPVYQGVDTSFLVATLTAAIQEQQTIINDLKARIETLETK